MYYSYLSYSARLSLKINALFLLLLISGSGVAQQCDCFDVLYLNDPGANYVEKFRVNPDGSLTEIGDALNGDPWLDATNLVDSPHGVAADLVGNVYVGELDVTNDEYNIKKFLCDGTPIDLDPGMAGIENFIDDGYGFNIFSDEQYLYVQVWNMGYNSTGEVRIYDLCDGSYQGCMDNAGGDYYFWGFARGSDGYWYGADGVNISRGLLDPQSFGAPGMACTSGQQFINIETDLGLVVPPNGRIQGLAMDDSGVLYGVVSADGGFDPPTYIFSYNTVTGAVNTSLTDAAYDNDPSDNLNWAGGRAILWSETSDRLYVSTGDDCIAAFTTDLVYDPVGSVHIQIQPGSFPKGMGKARECCPTNPVVEFDTLICNGTIGSEFLIQELFGCDDAICESFWLALGNTPGLTFDACDNSITIDAGIACGSFNIESDGAANNNQCGEFNLTLNVEVAIVEITNVVVDDCSILNFDIEYARGCASSDMLIVEVDNVPVPGSPFAIMGPTTGTESISVAVPANGQMGDISAYYDSVDCVVAGNYQSTVSDIDPCYPITIDRN